jgi:hypothetical protein
MFRPVAYSWMAAHLYCHVLRGDVPNNLWVLDLYLDLLDIRQAELQVIITPSAMRNYNHDNTLNASVITQRKLRTSFFLL